jgi:uncharacterized SAM-binding protein YcdF (DUF218 family)
MTKYLFFHAMKSWLTLPGLNVLFSLIGLSLYWCWRRIGMLFIILGAISLWLASTPIIAYNLIEILQNQYPTLQLNALTNKNMRGVIVVLGGGDAVSVEDNYKHTVSNVTLARIRYAVSLHQKTNFPILVSGGRAPGAVNSEADLMQNALRENFKMNAAIKEDKSMNTAEESKYVAALLKQRSFDVVYLVTNAWHMPRSVYAFKRAGINPIPAPMGYETYDHHYSLLSYVPNIHAFYATSIAMHEVLGLLWYYL